MNDHKHTAWAAEHVKRVVETDEVLQVVLNMPPAQPSIDQGGLILDCNCPTWGTCMNVACPRRPQVTC